MELEIDLMSSMQELIPLIMQELIPLIMIGKIVTLRIMRKILLTCTPHLILVPNFVNQLELDGPLASVTIFRQKMIAMTL